MASDQPSFDGLAPELKSYVCRFLPLPDLKSLALTSSTWQAVSEPLLWSNIDVYPVRYRTALARDATERHLRVSLLSALEARPARARYIRRLTIGSKPIEPDATERLLRILSPSLETLRLRHMSCGLGRTNGQPCADVSWGTISLAGKHFPRLQELVWPVSEDRISEFETVLSSMVALTRLTVCGFGSWIGEAKRYGTEDRADEDSGHESADDARGMTLPTQLKFFSTDVSGSDLPVKLCREIIERSPHLTALELGCEAVEDEDDDDEGEGSEAEDAQDRELYRRGIASAVASMKDLKALYLWYQCDTWEETWMSAEAKDGRPFESVEWLMIPRTWDENLVPPLPNLTTLIAVIVDTGDPLTCTSRPTPSHTGRLEDWFVEQLDNAPILTEIALYDSNERMIMRGSEWKDAGCLGFVIRTYVGPYGTLYHFRCQLLSSHTQKEYTKPQVDEYDWIVGGNQDPWEEQDGWVDLTLYQDRHLPYDVLRKVYELESMEVEFEHGGRELKLSDRAWTVLEEWRNGLSGRGT